MTTYRKIQIDPAEVERLAGQGMTHDQVAAALGISPRTLGNRKRDDEKIREAFQRGRAHGIQSVTGKLFASAMEGNTTCMIFYLKAIAGWRDSATISIQREQEAEEAANREQEEKRQADWEAMSAALGQTGMELFGKMLYCRKSRAPSQETMAAILKLWDDGVREANRWISHADYLKAPAVPAPDPAEKEEDPDIGRYGFPVS